MKICTDNCYPGLNKMAIGYKEFSRPETDEGFENE